MSWFAMLMPPNATPELVQRIYSVVNGVLSMPETRDYFQRISADPFPGSPSELTELIRRETRSTGDFIRQVGIEKFE